MKIIKTLIVSAVLMAGITMKADEKVTLNVIYSGDIVIQKWFEYVIKKFEESHPDIKVNPNIIVGDGAQYDTKLAMMLGDPAGSVDVAWTGIIFKSLYEAKKISPIPELKDWNELPNFIPAVMKENCMYGDDYYALPISTDTRGLWYNVNIFKKAGISVPWQPKNWAEIIDTCKTIKEKVPGVWPIFFGIKGADESTSMQTAFMLLSATGGKLYKDNKWVVESQGLYDTLKFIDTIYKENLGTPIPVIFTQANINFEEVYPPKQKIAIMLDGNWICGSWKKKNPETMKWYDFTALPMEYGQAPGFSTVSGGWILTLSAQTKHRKEAIEFMKFAAGKDSLLVHSQLAGNLVPRSDVFAMKDYPEEYKKPSELLQYTKFRPINNDYPAVSIELSTAIENAALGKMSPEEAMKHFAANVETLVGKDNVMKEAYKP